MSEPATPPVDDVDLLLPWYATGRLSPADAARVERALAADGDAAHRLAITEDERAEARIAAESLPMPSARARAAVFERIAALPGGGTVPARVSLLDRLHAFVDSLTPRRMAYAGAAAGLVIVLQAGLLTRYAVETPATYGTASGPAMAEAGTFALVSFVPTATAAQVSAFLAERRLSITRGPLPGGTYRVRISDRDLPAEERDRLLADLRARADVIALVLPGA